MKDKTNTQKELDTSSEVSGSSDQESNTNKPKESHLSMLRRRGPANPDSKIYQRSEKAIRRALFVGLSRRYLGLQAKAVFRAAHITAPTFYSHAENVNAALIKCETDLEKEFIKLANGVTNREIAWTITLNYIERNRDYFRAVAKARDFYLLSRMIEDMRPILVGSGKISEGSFIAYTFSAMSMIYYWMTKERFDKNRIEYYAKKLAQLRFMAF